MKSTSPAGRTSPEAELVEQLRGLFDDASERAGLTEWTVDLAGRRVLLRFAGSATGERLLPAFAHLSADPEGSPALTVHVWDSESTGSAPPVAPWGPEAYRERGIVRGYYREGFRTVWEWGPQALNVVDSEGGEAFLWLRGPGTLGLPERGAPLRTLLNLWLSGGDTQLVHGGAVGTPEGCVLLIGPSGAGKSSTALSCLGTGLGHIGEDYCLVSRGDPPRVSSVYASAKLSPASMSRLPVLAPLGAAMPPEDDPEGKALIDLAASAPEDLLRSAPLAAIAVPRIATGETATTSEPCSSGEALSAVAPSTMLQLPGNGEAAWRWLTELVRSVPCHRLELGSDPDGIAPAIRSLLEGS